MTTKLDGLSLDLEGINKNKLKSVFPECFTEGTLDIDKLLSLCGEYIDNDFEKYKFEWKGKAECLRLAQKRSSGTLRPCKEESVNFDDTENLYIEGDNLEVLKLLQTAYYRKVKMIYIDPPYNTGNDFVYEDDFKDPMARYKEVTQQTTKSNPETMGRFHTNWLNMMYPRLRLAANLLRDDGVIFISIDDNEVHNLRKLCDEVFGEENFIGCFVWQSKKGGGSDNNTVVRDHEYVIAFAKSAASENCLNKIELAAEFLDREDIKGKYRRGRELNKWGSNSRREDRPTMYFPIQGPNGENVYPVRNDGAEGCWRWGKFNMENAVKNGDVEFVSRDDGTYIVYEKIRNEDVRLKPYRTYLDVSTQTADGSKLIKGIFDDTKVFDFPKPIDLVYRFIEMGTTGTDIVLDFFSGSATTAHAVMQLNAEDGGNRKFICVQLPELTDEKSEAYKAGYKNICEIGKERIRRSGEKIQTENDKLKNITVLETEEEANLFVAAMNAKGTKGIEQIKPLLKQEDASYNIDTGFKVFKLDTSNLREWDNAPIEDNDINLFYQRLNDMVDSIKLDRTAMDVVYEVMLKMGIPLEVPVTYMDVNGKVCYVVGDLLLLICFAEHLTAEDIEVMAEYAPAKMILAEQSFADDSALSNAHYILRDRGIELKLV